MSNTTVPALVKMIGQLSGLPTHAREAALEGLLADAVKQEDAASIDVIVGAWLTGEGDEVDRLHRLVHRHCIDATEAVARAFIDAHLNWQCPYTRLNKETPAGACLCNDFPSSSGETVGEKLRAMATMQEAFRPMATGVVSVGGADTLKLSPNLVDAVRSLNDRLADGMKYNAEAVKTARIHAQEFRDRMKSISISREALNECERAIELAVHTGFGVGVAQAINSPDTAKTEAIASIAMVARRAYMGVDK